MIRRFTYTGYSGQPGEGVLYTDGSVLINDPQHGHIATSPELALETGILDRVTWIDQPELTVEHLQRLVNDLIATPNLAEDLHHRFGLTEEPT